MTRKRIHKAKASAKTKTKTKTTRTICYKGYGTNKSGNHTPSQFRRTMRKHHIYNCLDKFCKSSRDRQICALSRKCNRRNKKKKNFSVNQWMKWSASAFYGMCK